MKPYIHAKNSVRHWGGVPEDYLPIHNWFDQSKAHVANMKHRAMLHNSMGIFICEQVFGTYITNSDGKKVQVRDVGEQHVLEDLGTIPSVDMWLKHMSMPEWAGGLKKKTKFIPLNSNKED